MERGVLFGGLLISVSFLAAVLFNQSAVEEAGAPAVRRAGGADGGSGGGAPDCVRGNVQRVLRFG